jgi:hypothetical protein
MSGTTNWRTTRQKRESDTQRRRSGDVSRGVYEPSVRGLRFDGAELRISIWRSRRERRIERRVMRRASREVASKGEYSERSARCATFSTASSLLCRSAHKPRPDGQFHRVAGSPGPFAFTPATASPASLRPVFQSGVWSDAAAPNRGADRRC